MPNESNQFDDLGGSLKERIKKGLNDLAGSVDFGNVKLPDVNTKVGLDAGTTKLITMIVFLVVVFVGGKLLRIWK